MELIIVNLLKNLWPRAEIATKNEVKEETDSIKWHYSIFKI